MTMKPLRRSRNCSNVFATATVPKTLTATAAASLRAKLFHNSLVAVSGIVDQHVNRTEFRLCFRHDRRDRLTAGYVEHEAVLGRAAASISATAASLRTAPMTEWSACAAANAMARPKPEFVPAMKNVFLAVIGVVPSRVAERGPFAR